MLESQDEQEEEQARPGALCHAARSGYSSAERIGTARTVLPAFSTFVPALVMGL